MREVFCAILRVNMKKRVFLWEIPIKGHFMAIITTSMVYPAWLITSVHDAGYLFFHFPAKNRSADDGDAFQQRGMRDA